jgi:hypothetical protein
MWFFHTPSLVLKTSILSVQVKIFYFPACFSSACLGADKYQLSMLIYGAIYSIIFKTGSKVFFAMFFEMLIQFLPQFKYSGQDFTSSEPPNISVQQEDHMILLHAFT